MNRFSRRLPYRHVNRLVCPCLELWKQKAYAVRSIVPRPNLTLDYQQSPLPAGRGQVRIRANLPSATASRERYSDRLSHHGSLDRGPYECEYALTKPSPKGVFHLAAN